MREVQEQPGGRTPSTVGPHLRAGERLLWEGRPDPGVIFARQDAFLVPFSLLWATFAAIWEASAVVAHTLVGTIFGAPLAVFGVYIVAGRFLYKWHDRRRTRYAVTDQRALVVRLDGRQVLDAPVGGPMAVLRRRDGHHGSVVWAVLGIPGGRRRVMTFSGGNATMLRGTGWPLPGGSVVSQVAFFDVDRFDDLMAVVTRIRRQAGVAEPPRTLAWPGHATSGQPYGGYPYPGQPLGGPPPLPPTGPPTPVRRPSGPPAGWYPDPDPASTGGERWWDGVGWSHHVRPGPGSEQRDGAPDDQSFPGDAGAGSHHA